MVIIRVLIKTHLETIEKLYSALLPISNSTQAFEHVMLALELFMSKVDRKITIDLADSACFSIELAQLVMGVGNVQTLASFQEKYPAIAYVQAANRHEVEHEFEILETSESIATVFT